MKRNAKTVKCTGIPLDILDDEETWCTTCLSRSAMMKGVERKGRMQARGTQKQHAEIKCQKIDTYGSRMIVQVSLR